MAVITGTFDTKVVHDSSAGSSFALPGYGGIEPSWSATNYTVRLEVESDLSVYGRILSGSISDWVVANDGYAVTLGISRTSGTWEWKGSALQYPANYVELANADIDASDGFFDWVFTGGTPRKYICNLRDLGFDPLNPKDAYLWVSGTGTYPMTSGAFYPTPVRLSVIGIRELIDYFPLAIRKSSLWQSCNRSGGSVQIRKSGGWRDCKNSEGEGATSTVHQRKSGLWTVAPKIGLNA